MARHANLTLPVLSRSDEGVPATHIGIYDFFVLAPAARKYYGEEKAKTLRKNTFKNLLKLYHEYGATDYTKLWNLHVVEITDLRLNEFARVEELRPFCLVVECFQHKVQQKDGVKNVISFGIRESYITKYVQAKEKAKVDGVKFVPPTMVLTAPKVDRDNIKFGTFKFFGTEDDRIKLPRNALYRQFIDWCKKNGITLIEGCGKAMKTVIEQNPTDGVKPIEAYYKETVFDAAYLNKRQTGERYFMRIEMDGTIADMAKKIIYRYNLDPANSGSKRLTLTEYTEQALDLMNSKMPLKYSNPALLEEYNAMQALEKGTVYGEAETN